MKKIMFSDKYGLTQAVLEGRKTQTRRIAKIQPNYANSEIAFPTDFLGMDEPEKHPLYGAYCWVNNDNPQECTDWIKPMYKVGEIVAIAQKYEEVLHIPVEIRQGAGWKNKLFVSADLMPHQIRITNVRIERLQDISDEDCLKEGVEFDGKARQFYCGFNKSTNSKIWLGSTPREAYASLIDKVGKKGDWDSNPYVFVYDFELIK